MTGECIDKFHFMFIPPGKASFPHDQDVSLPCDHGVVKPIEPFKQRVIVGLIGDKPRILILPFE